VLTFPDRTVWGVSFASTIGAAEAVDGRAVASTTGARSLRAISLVRIEGTIADRRD
jgi:hypothetical protein